VGLTFAFYILYPARLMKEWSVLLVVGWGMLIGGVMLEILVVFGSHICGLF